MHQLFQRERIQHQIFGVELVANEDQGAHKGSEELALVVVGVAR